MILNGKHSIFKKSCLAMMLSLCSMTSTFAMQQLSDDIMAEATGEGLALLPENFKMIFQMPNDNSTASSYNRSLTGTGATQASQFDTGFIRIIPVGEDYNQYTSLSQQDLNNKQTKADIFIYGLALSGTDSNANVRFSNTGFNWGSETNPWLIRAGTEEQVLQFSSTNQKSDVSYFSIEAPLARTGVSETDNNIKLGLWLDAFSRKWGSTNTVSAVTGAPTVASDLTTDQRVRLQVVANGLSLSGSQVRFFQTQHSNIEQQKNTLGIANILRLNTNDNPSNLVYVNTAENKTLLDQSVLRISTATTNDGTVSTPALNRSFAPIFESNEGLYLYSPNINLVLGNMYQPFIVGSSGNNIVLEVTAIPKVADIYNKIYTDYDSAPSRAATLCNVASCGNNIKTVAGATYQGNNATHSSIAIGSVSVENNMLKAVKTSNATGIVFRSPGTTTAPVNLGSVAIDGVLIQHLKFTTTGL